MGAESALLDLYPEVWLPRLEGTGIGIDAVKAGGRPLQTRLSEKKEALIHERVMELLTQVQKRVFDTVTPGKVIEFFALGEGTPPKLGVTTGEVVTGFFSFLGLTRLTSEKTVAKAIAAGVEKRVFGYIAGGAPTLGTDGKYQVNPAKVRYDTTIAPDEIDLDSGFILLPHAIPQPEKPTDTGVTVAPGGTHQTGAGGTGPGTDAGAGTPDTPPGGSTATTGRGTSPGADPGALQTSVELSFSADSAQLYSAWQAIANLADLAEKVTVTVKAQQPKGFDKSKLTNGVLEPLHEAGLIK